MPSASRKPETSSASLVADILAVQERERKSLAWDLHENLAQTIAAAKIQAEYAVAALDGHSSDIMEQQLRKIVPLLQRTLDDTRRMCTALRPTMLDDLGLAATVSWLCRAFRAAHPDIALKLDLQGVTPDLPDPVKTAVYRVLEEAVHNAARHARAKCLFVMLRQSPQWICLEVADDGCGLDAAIAIDTGRGIGLAIMRERVESLAGSLRIDSTRCEGVRVHAHWPLQ